MVGNGKHVAVKENIVKKEVTNDSVEFYGCKFLEYGDDYLAEKNLISCGGITKVVWFRNSMGNSLVQFCQKRGRINNPIGCLDEELKQCHLYQDFKHIVPISSIKLD